MVCLSEAAVAIDLATMGMRAEASMGFAERRARETRNIVDGWVLVEVVVGGREGKEEEENVDNFFFFLVW